jgi:hypothetical protein
MRPRADVRRPVAFSPQLVLIFAFLNFVAVTGLYVFTRIVGAMELEGVAEVVRDRLATASDWLFELLSLPMIAVAGLTWFGVILNPFLHGFLAERLVSFYLQYQRTRRARGEPRTSNPERVGQTHAND